MPSVVEKMDLDLKKRMEILGDQHFSYKLSVSDGDVREAPERLFVLTVDNLLREYNDYFLYQVFIPHTAQQDEEYKRRIEVVYTRAEALKMDHHVRVA